MNHIVLEDVHRDSTATTKVEKIEKIVIKKGARQEDATSPK